jgi:hypothetical protein
MFTEHNQPAKAVEAIEDGITAKDLRRKEDSGNF